MNKKDYRRLLRRSSISSFGNRGLLPIQYSLISWVLLKNVCKKRGSSNNNNISLSWTCFVINQEQTHRLFWALITNDWRGYGPFLIQPELRLTPLTAKTLKKGSWSVSAPSINSSTHKSHINREISLFRIQRGSAVWFVCCRSEKVQKPCTVTGHWTVRPGTSSLGVSVS